MRAQAREGRVKYFFKIERHKLRWQTCGKVPSFSRSISAAPFLCVCLYLPPRGCEPEERELFVDSLLVRIYLIIKMILVYRSCTMRV